MKKIHALIFVSSLMAIGFASAASAQAIRPECKSMRDPAACTCAVENGGSVVDDARNPGKKRWVAPAGQASKIAWNNCTAKFPR